MKIVSVLVFGIALVASWRAVHAVRPISETMHVSIQENLKKIISDYVQKNRPTSRGLQFDKFWTEAISPTKVKADFVYSFEDASETQPARIAISGTAILNKIGESADGDTWSFDELKISDSQLDFKDPIHVTPGSAADDGDTVAPDDEPTPAPATPPTPDAPMPSAPEKTE